jgi:ABC-type sugar transport system ATPase subunit
MAKLEYIHVRKCFDQVTVLPDISLTIPHGSFTVFVGPSGCGKSTLLRLTAGLEDMTSGTLKIDDQDVTDQRPTARGVAMVFQSYALYPHMNVADNIGFALKMAKLPKEEIRRKVAATAETLQLTQYLSRKPGELSGGQRQRVAIGRAIVREPKVFLFDEPLSNLDAALRTQMRVELAQLHERLGATMIYVTHDQVEAMTLADRIVVLNKGIIEQLGAPLELYEKPRTLFVAGFIGSPKMNLFTGKAAEAAGAHTLGVRPEHLNVDEKGGEWRGEIQFVERLGSDTFLHIKVPDIGLVVARTEGTTLINGGRTIGLTPRPGFVHRFDVQGMAI